MNDLEQATVDELVDEINKRCVGAVVITVRTAEDDPKDTDFTFFYSGGLTHAIGMTSRALSRLTDLDRWDEQEEEGEKGESQ